MTWAPERVAATLVDFVAALDREAQAQAARGGARGGRGGGGRRQGPRVSGSYSASEVDLARLQLVCQHGDGFASPAGRTPQLQPPPPSPAELEAALDALARLLAAGGAAGGGRLAAKVGLQAVYACVVGAPRRIAALARHGAVLASLASLLGARDGDSKFLLGVLQTAMPAVHLAGAHPEVAAAWGAPESGAASLRALAVAFAGAFGALQADGGPQIARIENSAYMALCAALAACGDAERPGLQAAMFAEPGFAAALCERLARSAASLPSLNARAGCPPEGWPGEGAFIVTAALCSDGAVRFQYRAAEHGMAFHPATLWQRPSLAGARALAACPALLECVADTVVAGARTYGAAVAALGPAAGAAGRNAAALAEDVESLASRFWSWAVSILELFPEGALATYGGGGGGSGARGQRLVPALLGLAEAAQAVAGAPLRTALATVTSETREKLANLAAAAVPLAHHAVEASGGAALGPLGAAAAGGEPGGGALGALVRLGVVSELPLLAGASGPLVSAGTINRVFAANMRVRLWAMKALFVLLASPRGGDCARGVSAVLAASPEVAAALAASPGDTDSERRLALAAPNGAALVAERRARAAGILAGLIKSAADDAGGDAAAWLRGLAGCRAFLAGCDDALRRARGDLGDSGADGDGIDAGDTDEEMWARIAGLAVEDVLQQLARAVGGSGAGLEALRSAAAASFPEVSRVLEAAAGEEQGRGPAAAAVTSSSAAAVAVAAALAAAPAAAATTAAAPEAPSGAEAAARACVACGAADAPLKCGGCRVARYCGAECQKRDWRAHKAACKQQQHQQQQEQQQLLR